MARIGVLVGELEGQGPLGRGWLTWEGVILYCEEMGVFLDWFSLADDRERWRAFVNLLKPTGYVMHQEFNIQQLYVLPTLYLCVLYLSENKQRLVPLTA